eukprot:TRINITY_DN5681_c0_g2_i2.p1 TRINITY_DN5681_c0_g2~~TRINITY_DN5681_c0_g2_i2.p1  ORF type:complete len:909 (+),score=145.53 TRINITY_DN5681_c0_g2_i2:30-2756(+)
MLPAFVPVELPDAPDPPNMKELSAEQQRQVKGLKGLHAWSALHSTMQQQQLERIKARCCTDQWLDENEREWYCLDALMRSRPWATRKNEVFPYPFRDATDDMRAAEGPWVGDDQPFPREWTRGPAAGEVLENVRPVPEFPPKFRLILFAPEFGSAKSFWQSTWERLEPKEVTDIWVVNWQGWEIYDEMIEQVTRKVLSFADAVNTVWYGHSMGAIVAYEVLKRFEMRHQTPNLPVSLMVSGCPAPHLFSEMYRPHEHHPWLLKLRIGNDFDILLPSQKEAFQRDFQVCVDSQPEAAARALQKQLEQGDDPHDAFVNLALPEAGLSPDHRKAIVNNLKVLQSYHFDHDEAKTVAIPIIALCHEEDPLVPAESVEAWKEYANEQLYEFVALEDIADGEILADQGHGYTMRPVTELLEKITATLEKYEVSKDQAKLLPDLGPTDGSIPEEIDCVIVGAGIAGVSQGRAMAEVGLNTIILDREKRVGGIWSHYANKFSRVNSSEPAYRIVNQEGPGTRPNEDHSGTHDIMRDIYTTANKFCYGKIRLGMNVIKCEKRPDKTYDVTCENIATGRHHKIHAKVVCFHVNRRIGRRRDVRWPGDEKFRGDIVYGYANEVLPLKFWGKRVIVVGAGAFAYENLRTALEHGAKHVTILGRRGGTTCPKWIDMIAFLRPLDEWYNTNKNGNVISFEAWQKCYENAGLPTPDCWKEGLLKPHNHTISVSDLAYIAGFHGMVDLRVGEIAQCRPDGQGVVLLDGSRIDCEIIIKATGFHLNDEVPNITGKNQIYAFNMMDHNLSYGAEPLLDGAQFGSAKGRLAEEEEIDESAIRRGIEKSMALGLPDLSLRANPFGSSYVGMMLHTAYFTAWAVKNPELQECLMHVSGEPKQDVVKMWSSQISTRLGDALKKALANFGA